MPWRHLLWMRLQCRVTSTTNCWDMRSKMWSSSASCPNASLPKACLTLTTHRWVGEKKQLQCWKRLFSSVLPNLHHKSHKQHDRDRTHSVIWKNKHFHTQPQRYLCKSRRSNIVLDCDQMKPFRSFNHSAHMYVVHCEIGVCCKDCAAASPQSDPGSSRHRQDCHICHHCLPPG